MFEIFLRLLSTDAPSELAPSLSVQNKGNLPL
jgi:hypothetical protein